MEHDGGKGAGEGDSAPHIQPRNADAAQVCPCPTLKPLSPVRLPISIGAPAIHTVALADPFIYFHRSNSGWIGTMASHYILTDFPVESTIRNLLRTPLCDSSSSELLSSLA